MKKTFLVLLIIFLALVVAASGYFLISKKIITPFAQSSQPTIYLNPSSGSKTVGATFNVNIVADSAGQAITGVDMFYLHYPKQFLQVQDADSSASGIQITRGTLFPNYQSRSGNDVDTANGTINLSGYFNPGQSNQQAVSGNFATITFKAIAQGQAGLNFDFVVGSTTDTNMTRDSGGGNIVDILQSANGGNFSIGSASATVDLKADNQNGPITKNSGDSSTLSWTSTNANSCSASGGWSGNKQTSGSETILNLSASAVYNITCVGDGTSSQDSVTINVVKPGSNPPSIDLKANDNDGPISIKTGSSATLSWTSGNADSCNASGDWSGNKDLSGSESTGDLESSKTYNLACKNSDGEIFDSVTVNVSENEAPSRSSESSSSDDQAGSSSSSEDTSSLPSNIEPQTQPVKKEITLTKDETMKPWTLWFLYAIIPAFLAGGAIYLYLKRRKDNKADSTI